jgi:hypothetical protein
MPVAPDLSIFERNKGFGDYQRANDEFAQRKALQQTQIQLAGAQAQKAVMPDYAEMGQAAFIKAATQGAETLTPTEKALLLQLDAKQQTFGLNPVTGAMEQKPSMLDRAGINLGNIRQPLQNAPATQPMAAPTANVQSPVGGPQAPANLDDLLNSYTPKETVQKPLSPKSIQLQQEMDVKATADRSQNYTKAQSALQGFGQQSKLVTDTIKKAISLAKTSPTATNYGQVFSKLPNTDARALNNYLDTIKANIGFDALQTMRDNSPTGGALGQVSDMETRLLQATKGALDPLQGDQLVANLEIINELYPLVLAEKQRAFEQDFGNVTPLGNNPQPVVLSTDGPASDTEVAQSLMNAKKAIAAGKNPNAVRQKLIDAGIDPAMAGL